jgi:hypothetical protein
VCETAKRRRLFLAIPLLKHNRAVLEAQAATVEASFVRTLHLLGVRNNSIQLAQLLMRKWSPHVRSMSLMYELL